MVADVSTVRKADSVAAVESAECKDGGKSCEVHLGVDVPGWVTRVRGMRPKMMNCGLENSEGCNLQTRSAINNGVDPSKVSQCRKSMVHQRCLGMVYQNPNANQDREFCT